MGLWKWLTSSGEPNRRPICDVCSRPTSFKAAYALTTQQVVTEPSYWGIALRAFELELLGCNEEEIGTRLLLLVRRQCEMSAGWLVCENCSHMFEFDRSAAREWAAKELDPPGSGPVEPSNDNEHFVRALTSAFVVSGQIGIRRSTNDSGSDR